MSKKTIQQKMDIINKSPELWLKNFVKIIDANNNTIPFEIHDAQKEFLDNRSRFNNILKSRQLGFSTLSLGLMLYYAYTLPNTTYLMVAHNKVSLRELFNRLKFMQQSIPEPIQLKEEKNNREELVLNNGSRIIIQSPSEGLGAGLTLQMCHLSEFALYSKGIQSSSLGTVEQALAKNKDSMIIIESTARGIENYHYQLWRSSTKRDGRYKPFFFGWTDKSHTKLFSYEIDVAIEWYKSINKGLRLSADPLELSQYEKKIMEETNATLNQLMWRRWKLTGMSEETFQQEYPAFPEEAFISTSLSIFDAKMITERTYYVPDALTHIPTLPQSLLTYLNNGLKIYKLPKQGEKYFGGVDVAAGLKQDSSTINILDSNGEQVAVFDRNDIPPYKFTKIIIALGHYFNYTMFLIERNSYGLDVLNRLVKEEYYVQVLRTKKFDKITGQTKWEHGWYNDNVSKVKLVTDGREYVELGMVLINDLETLEQMRIYNKDGSGYGNQRGVDNHDDLVDGLLLSIQCLKFGRYYV